MALTPHQKYQHCGYVYDVDDLWYPRSDDPEVHTGDCDTSLIKCHNDDCKKLFAVRCIHLIRFEPCEEDDV